MFVKKILKLASQGIINNDSKKQLPGLHCGSSGAIQQKKIALPVNFADEVFNLELEAERADVDISVVNRLLELYATAIEYYETIKSDKYTIFKNKTRSLLLKQNVNLAMDKAQQDLKTEQNEEFQNDCKKEKQYELSLEDEDLKQRQKELELNVMYIQQQDTKDSVFSMIHSHSEDLRQSKKIIQQDTDNQQRLIAQRLQKRKNKIHGSNDTEENEQKEPAFLSASLFSAQQKITSNQPLKRQSSMDITNKGQSLLDMDINEISSTPMKTEPNDMLQKVFSSEALPENSKYYQTPLAYEQKILKQKQAECNRKSDRNYENQETGFSLNEDDNNEQLQNIQFNNKNMDVDQLKNNNQNAKQQQQNNPINSVWSGLKVEQAVSAFRAEGQITENSSSLKKKKKVRVSQKSVMEFQLQNSAIQF